MKQHKENEVEHRSWSLIIIRVEFDTHEHLLFALSKVPCGSSNWDGANLISNACNKPGKTLIGLIKHPLASKWRTIHIEGGDVIGWSSGVLWKLKNWLILKIPMDGSHRTMVRPFGKNYKENDDAVLDLYGHMRLFIWLPRLVSSLDSTAR